MSQMEIREVKPEDARGILEVLRDTWINTYPNDEIGLTKEAIKESFEKDFKKENIEEFSEKITKLSNGEKWYIAVFMNRVVGIICLFRGEEKNEIQKLYVLPEFQGKGIGKMFWKKALEFFDSKKDIVVKAVVYNKKAIEFYKKLGFVDTGKRFSRPELRFSKMGFEVTELELFIKGGWII